MHRIALAAATLVMTLGLAMPAAAVTGPVLVYTVPGIINFIAFGTFIICTAVNTPQTVTVQVLDGSGAAAGNASLAIPANGTRMFGTSGALGLSPDAVTSSPAVTRGYAQISSTSKALICSAILSDVTSGTPAFVSSLPVLKGAKQRGQ